MKTWILLLAAAAASLALLGYAGAVGAEIWSDWRDRPETRSAPPARAAIPLGVLGDSDSVTYHDSFNAPARFGRFKDTTFQWTEVLTRLRGNEIDLGERGVRGTRRSVARVMDALGLPGRHPRKDDNLFNLAFGGAGCNSLMGYDGRQAPRLVAAMNLDPARWRRGIVVIRIGVNDLGSIEVLDALARDPADAMVRARADACLAQIGAAVALIHGAHPMTHIVLVGVLSNADDPSNLERWRSGPAYQNIRQGLRYFDQGLARLAASDKRLAFFDDSAWFEARWGARDPQGQPSYKTLLLGPQRLPVTMTAGDHPSHAVTGDLHAGVVWTTLWAQSLVGLMDSAFDAGITPISDDEVAAFLTPALQLPQ
jgi:hypothetical protein